MDFCVDLIMASILTVHYFQEVNRFVSSAHVVRSDLSTRHIRVCARGILKLAYLYYLLTDLNETTVKC